MICGEKRLNYKCFEYYLRHCDNCGEIFKAYSKNGKRPKRRICDKCKEKIFNQRTEDILKTKQLIKEVENELSRNNNESKPFI